MIRVHLRNTSNLSQPIEFPDADGWESYKDGELDVFRWGEVKETKITRRFLWLTWKIAVRRRASNTYYATFAPDSWGYVERV